MTIGHCPHGEFDLLAGCPQCIAEVRQERIEQGAEFIEAEPLPLVKVRYYSAISGIVNDKEYSYYAEDNLLIGDVVMVPVRETITKAMVSAIDVPDSEIAAFRDAVKTIPAGSIVHEELNRSYLVAN